jgi:hypothetical protein
MEFRLSRSLKLSRSLFTNYSFTRWSFGYHGAFSQIFLTHDGISESQSLFTNLFSHDRILAIKEPFTNFSFSRWNLGYQGAFHELSFSQWNLGYQGAFSRITVEFWLSRSLFTNHGGILAIKELFHESRWNSGYQGAFSHDKIHKMHELWGVSFHIYYKEYLHRIRLIKNLAS